MTQERSADRDRSRRARRLFQDVAELPDREQAAFLDEACDDPVVRAEVDRLLTADRDTRGLLDASLPALVEGLWPASDRDEDTRASEPSTDFMDLRPGIQIDSYRLRDELGTGGMGVVWRAEQLEPLRRDVALKLVRSDIPPSDVVARFESERQALAVMEHPAIAKVFDSGTVRDGRPYFVMELIRGVPITEYCDTHRVSFEERIELFTTVCDAVHHAHQKGVIHRDLKPSNILISVTSGSPLPKVIDFGVAKAITGSLTPESPRTTLGQIIGTPQYMSPEQAESSELDVDTRTDVYSLGVVLYELLAGSLPFDRSFFSRPDFLMRYFLRDTDAPRPSARFETLDDTQVTVARNRSTSTSELRRKLKGDLDWITMRAMEKDRTRRYPSASELAADLRRFLAGEPVTARPPSVAYRFSRLVRRNRGAAAAAGFAVAAVLVGLFGTTFGMLRARAAEETARVEAQTAAEVADFLVGLFEVNDPSEAGGDSLSARELMDRGAADLRSELGDEPLLRARFSDVIRRVYTAMGAPLPALDMSERAVEIWERELGRPHPEYTGALVHLMRAYGSQGVDSTYRRRAIDTADRIDAFLDERGQAAPLSRAAAQLLRGANMHFEPEEADRRMRDALEGLQPFADDTVPRVELADLSPRFWHQHALNNNAIFAYRTGDLERAAELFGAMDADGPARNNLAIVLSRLGQVDSAIVLWEAALEEREEEVGPDHLTLARPLTNLGSVFLNRGDTSKAVEYMARADRIWNEAYGVNHRYGPKTVLSGILLAQGQVAEAERYAMERWTALVEADATDVGNSAGARRALARVLSATGQHREAEVHLRFVVAEMLSIWNSTLDEAGKPDPDQWYANELAFTLNHLPAAMEELAEILRARGRPEEAGELEREASAIREAGSS